MSLSKKILYSGAATSLNTIGGIVRNKLYAVYLSLSLFGLLSLGQQFISLVSTFFSFGLPLGVTTLSASLVTRNKVEQSLGISRIVVLSVAAALSVEVILLVVLLFFKQHLSIALFGSSHYGVQLMIMLHAVPFMIVGGSLYGVLEGMGKLREIVAYKTLPLCVSLPVIYYLSSEYFFIGASISVLVSEILVALVGMYLLKEYLLCKREVFHLTGTLKEIVKIAVLSFVVGVVTLLIDFVVKRLVLGTAGETGNGIVQSVAKVTDLYPMIVLSWLAMHLFPSLAREKEDVHAVANIIQRTAFVAVALIIPIIFFLFLFRGYILEIIYQKEFVQASQYFGLMLATGILKVFSWVIGIALLASGYRKIWFYSSLLYAVVFFLSSTIGIHTALSFYALPVGACLALLVNIMYVMYASNKFRIKFHRSFFFQLFIYLTISAFFCLAVMYDVMLLLIVVVYIGYLYHYGFVKEIRMKVQEFFSQP